MPANAAPVAADLQPDRVMKLRRSVRWPMRQLTPARAARLRALSGRVNPAQQASTCCGGAVFQTASDSRTAVRHDRRQAVLDCHVAPGFAALRMRRALAYAVN